MNRIVNKTNKIISNTIITDKKRTFLFFRISLIFTIFINIFFYNIKNPPKDATQAQIDTSRRLTLEKKYKIINRYVDFVKLGKIMERKRFGNAKDQRQYAKWVMFLNSITPNFDPNQPTYYYVKVDLENVKINNFNQLGAFLDSVLSFKEEELFYSDFSGVTELPFPLGLYQAITEGKGYYVDPSRYEVDSEFHEALYLDGYLK